MGDFVGSEQSSASHLLKQATNCPVEELGVVEVIADNLSEQPAGEKAGILGVEAEHYLVEIAGEFLP